MNIFYKSFLILTLLSISSCGKVKERFKLEEKAPDETQVMPYPDLSIPPEFILPEPVERTNKSSNNNLSKTEKSILDKIGKNDEEIEEEKQEEDEDLKGRKTINQQIFRK